MRIRPPEREYRTWAIDSRLWAEYQPRSGDIIIATAPKCGTTWMQQIVSSLVFQDAAPRALYNVSTWIDARFLRPLAETYRAFEAQTHRRFAKTHVPVDGLPIYEEVQYIHVARDGRDAALSMHNHFTGFSEDTLKQFDEIGLQDEHIRRPFPRFPSDPADYVRLWLTTPAISGQTDGTPYPSYFEFEAGYWAQRRRPNILLVHYSDLLHDLDAEMRRVAAFLNVRADERIWPSMVQAAEFGQMQKAGDVLMPHLAHVLADGSRRFFNKGTNGRWQAILGTTEIALYEAKVREHLTPGLSAWIAGGRLGAGGTARQSGLIMICGRG